MNYYQPNFYSNYPYNQYQQPVPTQQPMQSQFSQQMQMGLQGKVVDGEDIVKVTDVPVGGYGIFPKADLSEIYVKSWNNNGTTNIMTFKPILKDEKKEEENLTNVLLNKMKQLESKLDVILTPAIPTQQSQQNEQISTQQNTTNNNSQSNGNSILKRKEF